MTKTDWIPPSALLRRVVFVIYEGFEILDLSGPASVFGTANTLAEKTLYQIVVASSDGGPVGSDAGPVMQSVALADVALGEDDTLLVMGASRTALPAAMADPVLAHWLRSAAGGVARCGSVCAGAFVLAAAGLLDGRRATTHWAGLDWLHRDFPAVGLVHDAIYVRDGALWTSAGVTTGIDMALAMVAEDAGATLMGEVARALVVQVHRQGDQGQDSPVLDAQVSADGMFATVIAWIEANLGRAVLVAEMAEQAGMSERNFYRKFTASLGVTPSKYLKSRRMARARQLLEASLPVKAVASAVGYASEARFRIVFRDHFHCAPSDKSLGTVHQPGRRPI